MPRNFGSISVDPTVTIYGIPFDVNLFYDTRQEEFKQNINSFGFLFDPDLLKDKIQDEIKRKIEELESNIKETVESEINKRKKAIEKQVTSSLSPALKFFSYFDNLGLGETYPNYTVNTVNGVKMTGADISFNPGLLYLAISGINNQEAIQGTTYSRKMIAGSLGVGGKEESHFHFNIMKASTSTSTGLGFNLKINLKNAPYFIIDYRPNTVSNDASDPASSFKNTSNVFSLTTGLNQNTKIYSNSMNLVFSSISSKSDAGLNDYSIHNFNGSNSISFLKIPLTISGSAGYTRSNAVDAHNSFLFDLSAGYMFIENWNNSFGATYYHEEKTNSKSSLYFNSSYSVSSLLNIDFNLMKDFYREMTFEYGDYDNLIIRAGVSSNF
ncbi:MAG: hypothetical protein IPM96_16690 [Ignavibacteria bacterium]|nr:hypothetical protein [Ignavibacteria bacterium]